MPSRVCPACDARSDAPECPRCGVKTLRERRSDERQDPRVGRVLDGRYRIDALIARGGMGVVYRGTQLATSQTVAVKVVRAEDEEATRRFHREAKAASLLAHPHTVRVIDFGEDEDGSLYLVLEFLAGRTLGRLIAAEGALPEARVAKIACETAQSLAEAHARGLAHRDLKPENVMLVAAFGDADFVKVLDFGLAKFLSEGGGEPSFTLAGTVVGTPAYMAPEMVHGGRAVSTAVDVYALGIIAFQALSGVKPFTAQTAFDTLMMHVRSPVPELPPGCTASPAMRELLRRMLAKDPGVRPAAAEVAALMGRLRLAAVAGGLAEPVVPYAPPDDGEETDSPRPAPVLAWDARGAEDTPPEVLALEAVAAGSPAPAPTPTRVVRLRPPGAGPGETPGPTPAVMPVPERGGNAPWVVAGLLILAAAGAGGWWWLSTATPPAGDAAPAATQPAAAPPGATPPAPAPPGPVEAVPPAPPPVPAPLPVRFESRPPGATVSEGDRTLGTTPFDAVLAGPPGRRTFVFRLDRHRDLAATADLAPGMRVSVDLEPRPAAPARPRTPAGEGYRPVD